MWSRVKVEIEAALDLLVGQQVVGGFCDSLLDRLSERHGQPVESVGQQVLEALLDRQPHDYLVGKLGADPVDDHRVGRHVGDHADKSIGRQDRLVEPRGHGRHHEDETGEHAEEDREGVVDAVMLFHASTSSTRAIDPLVPPDCA